MASRVIGPTHNPQSHPLLQKHAIFKGFFFFFHFNQPSEVQQKHCYDLLHFVVVCDAKVK